MIELDGKRYSVRDVARALINANMLSRVVNMAITILRARLESVEDKLLEAEKVVDELYFAELEMQDANKSNVEK